MRGQSLARALGLAIAFVAAERYASASDPATSQSPPRRVVEVFVVDADGASTMGAAITELLARLGVVADVRAVSRADADDRALYAPARDDVLARVRVAIDPSLARVVVVAGASGEVVARRELARTGPDGAFHEELAHVVQAAVEPSLLAERDRRVTPPPVEAPAPPSAVDEASTPRPASVALEVEAAAGLTSFGGGAGVVPRISSRGAVAVETPLRPGFALEAIYQPPFEAGSELAIAHASILGLRGLPSLRAFATRGLAIDAVAGAGVDVVSVEPRSEVLPSHHLGGATRRLDVVLALAPRARIALGSGAALSLSVGADCDLATRRYVVQRGARDDVAFAPSRFRPVALVGLSVTALGFGSLVRESGTP